MSIGITHQGGGTAVQVCMSYNDKTRVGTMTQFCAGVTTESLKENIALSDYDISLSMDWNIV